MIIKKIVKRVFELTILTNKKIVKTVKRPIRVIRATNYALKKAKLI